MAYVHAFDAARNLILVVQSGTENVYKDMLDWMRVVRTDPAFLHQYGLLCDLREGKVVLSQTDAFTCGTVLRYFFPAQKVAFVVPAYLEQMVAQQALAVQKTLEVRGFARLEDAESWLAS
jgi:hypothetical protein